MFAALEDDDDVVDGMVGQKEEEKGGREGGRERERERERGGRET